MSVAVQPFADGAKRFSVPTTLSATTATMLSSNTLTFCSDWRGPGVKMVADFASMRMLWRTSPSTPIGKATSEPAA